MYRNETRLKSFVPRSWRLVSFGLTALPIRVVTLLYDGSFMKKIALTLPALLLVSTAGSADAVVINFNVAGVFSDGAILGGTFQEETTDEICDANIAITVGNLKVFNGCSGGGGDGYGAISVDLYNSDNDLLELVGPQGDTLDSDGVNWNFASTGGQFAPSSYYEHGGNHVSLISGSFVEPSAVPEPATWTMLILGMAAIGYSVRRSTVKFDVRIKRTTVSPA